MRTRGFPSYAPRLTGEGAVTIIEEKAEGQRPHWLPIHARPSGEGLPKLEKGEKP
jgi:hypothetical protein